MDKVSTAVVTMRSIHIPRKLFWSVLSVTIAIIAVLTSLTIYFAVRPHNQNHVYYGRTTSSETTESIELTTSRPSGRPVERIPSNLKPELYEWTIVLDLNDELFTGTENIRAPKSILFLLR